ASNGPKQVSKVERRRCVGWVAFHQDAVEALGLGNVSILLSQLRLLKQFVGSVLRPADGKHELAVFVGASTRLFDFEAAVGSRMKTHVGEASFRQPFPNLAHAANDFGQSNSVRKQLRDLTSACQVAKTKPTTPFFEQTESREFLDQVARQLA